MSDEQDALALLLAREWQTAIAALAADTAECLETVTSLELKPGLQGHPFYWGKMSLLRTLRPLADADVARFATPGAVALLDRLEQVERERQAALAETATLRHALINVRKDVYFARQTVDSVGKWEALTDRVLRLIDDVTPNRTPGARMLNALLGLQVAWDRLGACVDEFAPDMEACAELNDQLDTAILAVLAVWQGTALDAHARPRG